MKVIIGTFGKIWMGPKIRWQDTNCNFLIWWLFCGSIEKCPSVVFKEWEAHPVSNLLSNGSGSVLFCLKIFQKVPLPFYLLHDLKNDYNNDEDDEVEDGYFNIKSFIKLFLETKYKLFYIIFLVYILTKIFTTVTFKKISE